MSRVCLARLVLGVICAFGVAGVQGQATGQSSQLGQIGQEGAGQSGSDAPQAKTTPRTRQRTARRRRHSSRNTAPADLTGSGSAAPDSTPAVTVQEAQQKAADQKLLVQQQAQSDRAAQINNQQVRAAQGQQDRLQNETRIEDAPGPAQTGVTPNAAPGTQPASTDTRIQDAPGPSETLPQPAQNQAPTPR